MFKRDQPIWKVAGTIDWTESFRSGGQTICCRSPMTYEPPKEEAANEGGLLSK